MNHRILNKIEELSSSEIQKTMDFERVLEQASAKKFNENHNANSKGGKTKWVYFSVILVAAFAAWYFSGVEHKKKVMNEELPAEKEVVVPIKPEVDTLKKQSEPTSLPANKVPEKKGVEGTEQQPKPEVVLPIEKEQPETTVVYEDVIIPAKPIPGKEAFDKFINEKLVYPESELDNRVEGYVRVFFTVNKMGVAEDFKIRKSLGEAFDKEAIRVLKLFQQWESGSYNGEAVDSYLNIKVNFSLTGKDNE